MNYKIVNSNDARKDFDVVFLYGDMHIPYENIACRNIMLSIINKVEPNILISGGDDIDGESVSMYDKYTSEEDTLQRDLDAFYHFSSVINSRFPKMKKIYLKDNHLYERLEKHKKLNRWMQSMHIFDFESLIRAKEYGWNVMNEFIWKDTILVTHGHEEKGSTDNPVNTVRGNFKRNGYSIIRFHSHVTGIELHNHCGNTAMAVQLGTFQDISKAKYIKSKERSNWTTSAGVLYLSKTSNDFFFEPILFFNNEAVFRGSYYKG